MKTKLTLVAALALIPTLAVAAPKSDPPAHVNYWAARQILFSLGLKPAPIPHNTPDTLCGTVGEGALCKTLPELVDCEGMGASAGTCRMAFVDRDGTFVVATAFGWEHPRTMELTGITHANATDSNEIKRIIAGKAPLGDD